VDGLLDVALLGEMQELGEGDLRWEAVVLLEAVISPACRTRGSGGCQQSPYRL